MIRSLSIEITSQCNIRCAHCAPMCGPKTLGVMDLDLIKEAVATAADMEIPRISATGGEPFLFPETISTYATLAKSRNLRWRIVTNGYWGASTGCQDTLKSLANSLPGGLSISVDRFHQEHLPLSTIKSAVDRAHEYQIPVELNFVIDRHPDTLAILREVSRWDTPIAIASLASLGRAAEMEGEIFFEQLKLAGCDTSENPYLRLDGTVTLCCGVTREYITDESALVLGNAKEESLFEVLRRHNNGFANCLKSVGPYRLNEYLKSILPEASLTLTESAKNYCALCCELSSRPEIVELIRNSEIDLVVQSTMAKQNTQANHGSLLQERMTYSLESASDVIMFPKINEGDISGRVHLKTAGLVSFKRLGQQEYCLVDEQTALFLQNLKTHGWTGVKGMLQFDGVPSLNAVAMRTSLSKLYEIGALSGEEAICVG